MAHWPVWVQKPLAAPEASGSRKHWRSAAASCGCTLYFWPAGGDEAAEIKKVFEFQGKLKSQCAHYGGRGVWRGPHLFLKVEEVVGLVDKEDLQGRAPQIVAPQVHLADLGKGPLKVVAHPCVATMSEDQCLQYQKGRNVKVISACSHEAVQLYIIICVVVHFSKGAINT